MTKKAHDSKPQKKVLGPSVHFDSLRSLLEAGNNFEARKIAMKILSRDVKSDADITLAHTALRITWPDTIAILAGLASLVVTVGVGFLVAY